MTDNEIKDILLQILIAVKELKYQMELLYNLFSKYDSMAIQELEDLRTAEQKK